MNLFRIRRAMPVGAPPAPAEPADDAPADLCYEPPQLVELGGVRRLTLGSSSSGNADSNSQYYW